MQGSPDFDELSRKATQTQAVDDLNNLFAVTFALPEWNFIMRGSMPNVYPYVASNEKIAGNQPMVRAFTEKKLSGFSAWNDSPAMNIRRGESNVLV